MTKVNWDKVKIHCSSIYNIIAGDGKSNMEIWKEACEEYAKKERQFNALKNKDGVRGKQYEEAMDKLLTYIPILEAHKDDEKPLSKGCKNFLSGIYAYEKYHKWNPSKDIGSKQTEKGKEVEPESLKLVSILDGVMLFKNEERIENEWFSGLPDAYEGEKLMGTPVIHDVKSPYDIESFFSYLTKDIIPVYYWQMQGYMDISGAPIAKVHFCLVNTPEHSIKRMADAMLSRMDVISQYSPEYIKAENELINNLTFDDMPMEDRKFTFTVVRNDTDIQKARKKVEQCRKYLQEFEELHLNFSNSDNSRILAVNSSYEQE